MKRQDDARRFAEVIIRDYGARALGTEQRPSVANLWREVAEAIEKLQKANKGTGA
jgi:hypothetical protein